MSLDLFAAMDVIHAQLGERCRDHEDGTPDCMRIAEALVAAEKRVLRPLAQPSESELEQQFAACAEDALAWANAWNANAEPDAQAYGPRLSGRWAMTGVAVGEVEERVALENLDRLARRFLSISGSEFLRRRAEGALSSVEHEPGFTRVLAVATLLD